MPTIRIDYHQQNKLDLIIHPICKSVGELRSLYPSALICIRTGWLHGPHLELCVVSDTHCDVSPQVEGIKLWITEHPSDRHLDDHEYEKLSSSLGALEGIEGPYLPLRSDNNVALVQNRKLNLVEQHDVLQEPYLRFFDRSTPILFKLAALKLNNTSMATLVKIAMLTRTADQYRPEGLARGYLSLQAHADFFFANFDQSGRFRHRYEEIGEAWREQIALAVQGRPDLATTDEGTRSRITEIIELWDSVLKDTDADIRRAIDLDSSWFDYNPAAFDKESRKQYQEAFAKSGLMMRKIEKGETLQDMLGFADESFFRTANFQAFRVLLNMYYSFLRNLNVSPAERFGLCHLASTSFCTLRGSGISARFH